MKQKNSRNGARDVFPFSNWWRGWLRMPTSQAQRGDWGIPFYSFSEVDLNGYSMTTPMLLAEIIAILEPERRKYDYHRWHKAIVITQNCWIRICVCPHCCSQMYSRACPCSYRLESYNETGPLNSALSFQHFKPTVYSNILCHRMHALSGSQNWHCSVLSHRMYKETAHMFDS